MRKLLLVCGYTLPFVLGRAVMRRLPETGGDSGKARDGVAAPPQRSPLKLETG